MQGRLDFGRVVVFGVVLVCVFCSASLGAPWLGSGDANDPYQVWTAEDMQAIGADSNYWGAHFILMADIDLGGYTGETFNIIGKFVNWGDANNNPFTGVFDGNEHAISNFTYSCSGPNGIGLFAYVGGASAEIRDLGLIDANVDGGIGKNFGLLVGEVKNGKITNCYADGGSISGSKYVGGLIGLHRGLIDSCYSTAIVNGDSIKIGGLVGWNERGTIMNCYCTGGVSGNEYVGGLVGYNVGPVSNCYSTGIVSGANDVGGLVGRNYDSVQVSYWDTETSAEPNSSGGTGKSTAEMMDANTFIGWGCDCAWTIDDGNDYPRLVWENKLGELITNPSYLTGGGTEGDPYLVYTTEQLNTIGLIECDWDKHFRLMADIDLSELPDTVFNIIGVGPGLAFTGVFDGNGHTISSFRYDSPRRRFTGIFGYVDGPDAEIKNLGLKEPNIAVGTGDGIGSLAGLCVGNISNCFVEGGSVSGDSTIGGLVGVFGGLDNALISCYSTCSVSGNECIGGLVAGNGGNIHNSYSIGNISGNRVVGGFVGENIAGFSGAASISNCYARGSVSGDDVVGGLVGYNTQSALIRKCYSTGSVSGNSNMGGLIGINDNYAPDSFWDKERSDCDTSDGGTGLTTEEMQMESTFTDAGWDFVGEVINGANDIWQICEGEDYPRLAWEKYGGGNGTEASPYLIRTSCQMNAIGANLDDLDKHFKLMADIDLSAYTGTSFNIIGERYPGGPVAGGTPFTGVFDGDGHTISNFSYTSTWKSGVGLFGYVDGGPAGVPNAPNVVIQDLGLVDPNIQSGGDYVGGLVGDILGGTVKDCYVQGGRISGRSYVGGLLGGAQWSLMTANRVIARCYNSASVSGEGQVGGLVGGHFFYEISNSYSRGDVVGEERVGGLVGMNWSGTISDCYSAGSVSGTMEVGGLVGYDASGVYIKSFCDSDVNPDVNGIGNRADPDVIGLTTAEMQMESTFTDAGWDFVDEGDNGIIDIWRLCNEGTEYPQLNWQYPAGDFVCPDGVDWFDVGLLCEEWLLEELSGDVWPEDGDGFVDFLDWAVLADGWGDTYDIFDLAEFAGQWLQSGSNYLVTDIAPGSDGDGITNGVDFAVLAENWLRGI